VILVDEFLKAFSYSMSKELSVFVGLIITNCIVMGRLEAFAMHNPWKPSLLDGIGSGVGYGIVLLIIGFLRELLGAGKLFGIDVIPEALKNAGYVNNGIMVLGPGAFLCLGLIIWLQRSWNPKLVEKD
jgi:Na+-transporting NADH:ubiquinone oxidoreductase subunit D